MSNTVFNGIGFIIFIEFILFIKYIDNNNNNAFYCLSLFIYIMYLISYQ